MSQVKDGEDVLNDKWYT